MTRREFIHQLIKVGSSIVLGISWLGRKTMPRKFIRALCVKKYPGPLKPLKNISKQGKWNG